VQGIVGFFVFLAGILLLLAFLTALRERLAAAEGQPARLSALAFGAGIASAAIWVVSMLIARADTFAASNTSKFHVDPNGFRMFADTAYFGWVAATLVSALVVWATSAVALRTGILPRLFARLGIVIGISQLFGIFFFPFFAWWIWIIATSILLVRRRSLAAAAICRTGDVTCDRGGRHRLPPQSIVTDSNRPRKLSPGPTTGLAGAEESRCRQGIGLVAFGRVRSLAFVNWEISANLGRHERPGVDARGWLWAITRGDESADVVIEISGTAWSSDPVRPPEDTRQALETDGRSELLKVLDQDKPPRVVRCGSSGCSYLSADEVGEPPSRT
jgi:hypothetical protein